MTTTLANALNLALHHQMKSDSKVIIAGQDIGINGGVFRITEGLIDQFGAARVIDTPISESFQAGFAIGLALSGYRPIMEFQFMGFMYSALEQIISHASRFRNRTRGQLTTPVVFRAPFGGHIHAPEHHSESMEALFCQIPGLRVISPSTPHLGYHLLRQAIECADPVVFLEPKALYRALPGEIDFDHPPKLGQAHILSPGEDLTIITWGGMISAALKTAQYYRQSFGIEIEVIDLSSLHPIDKTTIIQSVQKTKRALILHEAAKTGAIGAEIMSILIENCHNMLIRPHRLGGLDIIPPYYQNEKFFSLTAGN